MPYKDPEKQREFQRDWMRRRRAEYFADKVCALCSGDEELELDHLDPTKKVSHKIWSWSQERREAELAKCRVLCYDCHLQKSATERAKGEAHGKSKLTEELVHEIRAAFADGMAKRAIARKYQMSPPAIRDLLAGRTWSHV